MVGGLCGVILVVLLVLVDLCICNEMNVVGVQPLSWREALGFCHLPEMHQSLYIQLYQDYKGTSDTFGVDNPSRITEITFSFPPVVTEFQNNYLALMRVHYATYGEMRQAWFRYFTDEQFLFTAFSLENERSAIAVVMVRYAQVLEQMVPSMQSQSQAYWTSQLAILNQIYGLILDSYSFMCGGDWAVLQPSMSYEHWSADAVADRLLTHIADSAQSIPASCHNTAADCNTLAPVPAELSPLLLRYVHRTLVPLLQRPAACAEDWSNNTLNATAVLASIAEQPSPRGLPARLLVTDTVLPRGSFISGRTGKGSDKQEDSVVFVDRAMVW